VLAHEEVIGRQRLDDGVVFAGTLGDRHRVDRIVALAVDDLERTVDGVDGVGGVQPLDNGIRGEHGDGNGPVPAFAELSCRRKERHRSPEAIPEQADEGILFACPREGVADVGLFALAFVPGAVIDAQTGHALLLECVADGAEPGVAAVPTHLWVWRAGDHDGLLAVAVQARADVAGTRNPESLGHMEVLRVRILSFVGYYGTHMGILSRASVVIRSKVNALLNRAEDPTQTLDYSYEQLQDELQDVKEGIADLTTQKKRLEIQQRRLEENVEKHNDQAREAVRQDRDDLARRALEKKKQKMTQIEQLDEQIADLQTKQQQLIEKKDKLQQRIEEFRTRKETMKARYEAAEASARVSEAMTGASDEMSDISRTIERAQERTQDMEARSAALDELQESGALESELSDKSKLDRELEQLSTEGEVESELETLKSEMGDSEEDTEESAAEAEAEAQADDVDPAEVDPPDVDEREVEAELEQLKEEES
jgi:phage shock protein A